MKEKEVTTWPGRPSMRVITAARPMGLGKRISLSPFGAHEVPSSSRYAAPVKHDDVIIVPEFFCTEDDWDTYYTLIKVRFESKGVWWCQEMRDSQAKGDKKADWISWHEGAHLLSQNPTGSATYNKVGPVESYYAAITRSWRRCVAWPFLSRSGSLIEAATSMPRREIGARASIGTEMDLTGNPSIMTLPTGRRFDGS